MNWVAEIRNKYGISQIELSVYLNVSQPTIALSEKEMRDLPTKAMIILEPFLVDNNTPLATSINDQLQALNAEDAALAAKEAAIRQDGFRLKLRKEQKKLASMKEKMNQVQQALQLASRLSNLPDIEINNRAQALMNSLLAKSWQTIRNNGLAAQQKVEVNIQSLINSLQT